MAVFYISGLTLIVGTSFYIVFGSGEIQPWADGSEEEDDDEKKEGKKEGEKEKLLPEKKDDDLQTTDENNLSKEVTDR